MSFTNYEISVLEVMHVRKVYGCNHKKIETILNSGFPKHELHNIKKAIKGLLRKKYILWYNKSKNAIHLDKHLFVEIANIIGEQ